MPKSPTEKETKEWFDKRINSMKETYIRLDTHYKSASTYQTPNLKWSLLVVSQTYRYFTEIYEILSEIAVELLKREKEVSKFSKQIKKLRDKIESQEPTIARIREAFEQTQEWLEEGR